MVDRFYAHHDRVIHIAYLITPGSESATRIDVLLHQCRLQNTQSSITIQGRDGVRVLDCAMISRDDPFPVRFLENSYPNQSRDNLIEDTFRIRIFASAKRYLTHQRAVALSIPMRNIVG